MMARWHESWFPTLKELGIGFVAFSPLANGLLSNCYSVNDHFDAMTDYRAVMPQYRKESFEQNKVLFAYIEHLANKHHATPAQISLASMMCKKPWIVPIPCTRRLCRLKENIGAADIVLSHEEIQGIGHSLDNMKMSEVFGGSPDQSKQSEVDRVAMAEISETGGNEISKCVKFFRNRGKTFLCFYL